MISAIHVKNNSSYDPLYYLQRLPDSLLEKTLVIDLFAILPEYRKTCVSIVLFDFIYRYALENNYEVVLLLCETGLYNFYKKCGFESYGKIRSRPYGYLIPLFGFIREYEYIKKTNFLMYKVAKSLGFPEYTIPFEDKKLFYTCENIKKFKVIDNNFINNLECQLSYGISNKSKKLLFENSILILSQKGESIIGQNDGSKFICIIYNGSYELQVETKNSKICVTNLTKDDIIGHISFLTNIQRIGSVVCQEDGSSAIILSVSAIEKIKNYKEDYAAVWKNLAKSLANNCIKTVSHFNSM